MRNTRRTVKVCENGYVIATTLPCGEQYPTPWGLSRLMYPLETMYRMQRTAGQTESLPLDSMTAGGNGSPTTEG